MPLMKKILLTLDDEFPILTSYPVIQTFVGYTTSTTDPLGRPFIIRYSDNSFTQGYIGTNGVTYKMGAVCTCDSNIAVVTAVSDSNVLIKEVNKDGSVVSNNTFGVNLSGALAPNYAMIRGNLYAPFEYLSRYSSIINAYQYDTNTIRVIYYKKGVIEYKDLSFTFDTTNIQFAYSNIKQKMYNQHDAVGFLAQNGTSVSINFIYLKYGNDPEIITLESYTDTLTKTIGSTQFVFNEDITKVFVKYKTWCKAYTLNANKTINTSYYISSSYSINLTGINSTFDKYAIYSSSSSTSTTYNSWLLTSAGKTTIFTGTTATTNAIQGSLSIGRDYSLLRINTGTSAGSLKQINWDGTTSSTSSTAKLVYGVGTVIQSNLTERAPYGISTGSGYTTYAINSSTSTISTTAIASGGNGVLYPTDITFY